MRYVTFVDRLELSNVTTTTSANLFLFDVDNDGDAELVVGHWDMGDLSDDLDPNFPYGSLLIVKYGRVWKSYSKLKMVTCVSAGHICYKNRPLIVALCADSECYIFDAATSSSSVNRIENPDIVFAPVHTQKLALNAKDVQIMDGHGPCDMVVAYSDRVVRLYRWKQSPDSAVDYQGELDLVLKWELAGQIGRISVHSTPSKQNLLVASQPGGGFAFLQKKFETYKGTICPTLVYHPPRPAITRSVETRTWIMGNIRRRRSELDLWDECDQARSAVANSSYMALCLADGTVLLIDADLEKNEVIWCAQLQVQGELFGLSKLNLTSPDAEDVSVCCWDGSTYIFNHCKDLLRFLVGQSCQGFLSGNYAVRPGHNEPVLIYATCEHSILVYYNLNIDSIPVYSLHQKLTSRSDILEKLQSRGVDTADPIQLNRAVNFLLYGFPDLHRQTSLPEGTYAKI